MTQPLPRRLVTHNGSAHADEVVATALVLALDHRVERIERKPEPNAAELVDPDCYVLDFGRRHEPALLNFDHHQFAPDEAPRCTITLILEHAGLLEQARTFWPSLPRVELYDVRGPDAVALAYGLSGGNAVEHFQSPVEEAVRSAFSQVQELNRGDALFTALALIGQSLVEDLRAGVATLAWLREHAMVRPLAPGVNLLWFEDRPSAGPEVYNHAFDVFRAGLEAEVRLVVVPDSRGAGWQMRRLSGWDGADFRRVAGSPLLKFIHVSGFLATTYSREPRERVEALIREALVDRPGGSP